MAAWQRARGTRRSVERRQARGGGRPGQGGVTAGPLRVQQGTRDHRRRLHPAVLAGALLGAHRAVTRGRADLALDVVWTGPTSDVTTSRLTSAVVVELVEAAAEELLLVSYATHPPAELHDALHRAVDRGVSVTLLLERHADNPRFSSTAEAFPGLRARRLTWPQAHRPAGASMHAKILVVDRSTVLIGSANLTGHAMEHNLECGVLIRSHDVAETVADHLLGLLGRGQLQTTEW